VAPESALDLDCFRGCRGLKTAAADWRFWGVGVLGSGFCAGRGEKGQELLCVYMYGEWVWKKMEKKKIRIARPPAPPLLQERTDRKGQRPGGALSVLWPAPPITAGYMHRDLGSEASRGWYLAAELFRHLNVVRDRTLGVVATGRLLGCRELKTTAARLAG
jgi:hypothetical protein